MAVETLVHKTHSAFDVVAEKIFAGERLSAEDALILFGHKNPLELAALANLQRQRQVPGRVVTYVIGRILNYTNVCWVRCKFCAFYRVPGNEEGYLLSDETILDKVRDTVEKGGVEILFQGGLNPKLKIDYFENIFSKIKERYPQVILHALSPAEIIYIAQISKLTLVETLERLHAAGLHSIPPPR
jgi:cyclic dehypoxanthinyl futalosine synthase